MKSIRRHRLFVPGMIAVLATLTGCSAPANWKTIPTEKTFGDVWQGLVKVARNQRFYADPAETDRGRRIFVSKWKTKTHVFSFESVRTRLHAKIERDPDNDDLWLVDYYVQQQRVTTPGRGMRPTERDYSSDGQSGEEEDQILGGLNLELGRSLGVTPTFQRR